MLSQECPKYKPLGRHLLVDLIECQCGYEILNNERQLLQILRECLTCVGATPLTEHFYKFTPQGISALIFLAESHIAIYTYPEHCIGFLDFFTCGDKMDPKGAMDLIIAKFKPKKVLIHMVERG